LKWHGHLGHDFTQTRCPCDFKMRYYQNTNRGGPRACPLQGHPRGVPLHFLLRRQCTQRGRQAVPLLILTSGVRRSTLSASPEGTSLVGSSHQPCRSAADLQNRTALRLLSGSHGTAFVPWVLLKKLWISPPKIWSQEIVSVTNGVRSSNQSYADGDVEEPTAQRRCRGYPRP
jgi:hypothetical protein